MMIHRMLTSFVVFTEDSLATALQKISDNQSGLVFAIAPNGVIEGVLTDGDFRRWLLSTRQTDLSLPISSAFNREFVCANEDASADDIRELLSDRIRLLPLLDHQRRLVAIASNERHGLQLGDIEINHHSRCFIIAEIGNNHNGSIVLAKQLIDEAVSAGADCAKFQMRDMASMYRQTEDSAASEDLGAQYTLDLLARFQLSNDELFSAFDYCKDRGILPLCTPWDVQSLQTLESYGMVGYKVASADLTHPDLLLAICKTHKPFICSTGMSSEAEIIDAVTLLKHQGASFALLQCNSTYPAPFKDINLNYLDRLKKIGGDSPVGYSGHERGYSVAIAAVAKGAKIIEKHLTLDRKMEGNDHRVSLLPQEFAQMVQAIREVESSLGTADARRISQGEMMNREVLAKSIVARHSIQAGEVITAEHLMIRSPGKGLAAYRKQDLIGRVIKRTVSEGDFFYASDIEVDAVKARNYQFSRPFGVPVRYHDVAAMIACSKIDLLEFHFSYQDMSLNAADFLDASGYDLDFIVHAPELFANDHLLDLCADDALYRQQSIAHLQEVIHVTRSLKKFFRTVRPLIIVNVGGFSLDGFMPKAQRQSKYHLIADALSLLDTDGVEIIPQTMPPFPWHFGGQRYHNLFMDAQDIVNFCVQTGSRVCLDISHSKLACAHTHSSFSQFLEDVAPHAAHLHLVDALGVDGEGLQIGDGDIDFVMTAQKLSRHCPTASFIPEVWQGHKNNGEGFWIALEKLEAFNF